MARIITKNKNLMQSYIFTAAKYDFTAYEKRIMYRLVECAQDEIAGIKIKDHLHKIQPVQLGREITLPTSSILRDEKDENYTIAKKLFKVYVKKLWYMKMQTTGLQLKSSQNPKYPRKREL